MEWLVGFSQKGPLVVGGLLLELELYPVEVDGSPALGGEDRGVKIDLEGVFSMGVEWEFD